VNPSREQIEAGALAILNERLRQNGVAPVTNLDVLYPHNLLEVMADSEAALRTVESSVNADLLAALKGLISEFDDAGDDPILDAARVAIAKAAAAESNHGKDATR
jgi:hypothetical protein